MLRVIKHVLGAVLVASGAWRIARRRNRHRIGILMYHGITDQPIDTWTQLPTARFAEQMSHLGRYYRPVSLDEAVESMRNGKPLPPHSVVITFDDGFRNNVTEAYPILQHHGFPAIIYLATSFVDREPRFGGLLWTDRLFALLQSAGAAHVDLSSWGLGRLPLGTEQEKRHAKGGLAAALKRLSPERKNAILDEIAVQTGPVPADLGKAIESLSWDEARRLDGEGLVTFGAHTVHHDILTRLAAETVEAELVESKARIEAELGREIRHFAYPNGTRADFDEDVKRAASRHFASAVTTIDGLNESGIDLYELRRVNIGRDISSVEFTLRLCGLWPRSRG